MVLTVSRPKTMGIVANSAGSATACLLFPILIGS